MVERLILKSQATQIYNLIKDRGFQNTEFYWDRRLSSWGAMKVSVIIHKPTNYYYVFDLTHIDRSDSHACEFSPGNNVLVEKQSMGGWDYQTYYFSAWLEYLRREVETPDLWSAISQEENLSKAAMGYEDNSNFSAEQKIHLTKNLLEIKEYLQGLEQFSDEQKAFIDSRVEYLEKAIERMGKKDWINLTLGVLTNVIIGLAMNADKAREFFRFAGDILNWLLGGQKLL